jgi:polynucleotide 5'-kinase involved in rRNA processing
MTTLQADKFMENGKVDILENNLNRKHCEKIPTPLKCIIVGRTNSGKTHLLIRMLIGESILDYDEIHLISNSCDQSKYVNLKLLFDHGCSKKNSKTSI